MASPYIKKSDIQPSWKKTVLHIWILKIALVKGDITTHGNPLFNTTIHRHTSKQNKTKHEKGVHSYGQSRNR